jgi:hypothetical protein
MGFTGLLVECFTQRAKSAWVAQEIRPLHVVSGPQRAALV